MTPLQRRTWVHALARQAGFDLCGVALAVRAPRADQLRAWLDAGRAGTMHYMRRWFEQRVDPRNLVEGARSVVMVGLNYHRPAGASSPQVASTRGRIARYAWGEDYHKVLKRKLKPLAQALLVEAAEGATGDGAAAPSPAPQARICVDTAPILEREFAELAGLGWIGKNTLVLNPDLGSYFFLGAIVTTVEIEPDDTMPDHCGTCTRCLDACPTQAFVEPYKMDASRCISYLTIERREEPPDDLKPAMRGWLFGCDICQEVCPFNRHAPHAAEPAFAARQRINDIRPADVLTWTPEDYARTLNGTAMKRATLSMWQRNAMTVLEEEARSVSPAPPSPEPCSETK